MGCSCTLAKYILILCGHFHLHDILLCDLSIIVFLSYYAWHGMHENLFLLLGWPILYEVFSRLMLCNIVVSLFVSSVVLKFFVHIIPRVSDKYCHLNKSRPSSIIVLVAYSTARYESTVHILMSAIKPQILDEQRISVIYVHDKKCSTYSTLCWHTESGSVMGPSKIWFWLFAALDQLSYLESCFQKQWKNKIESCKSLHWFDG